MIATNDKGKDEYNRNGAKQESVFSKDSRVGIVVEKPHALSER
jgi:hypothetical protein